MIRVLLCLTILLANQALAFVPITTDARIKTLIYSPTEVFRLKFHRHFQSYVEFPEYEKFKVISVGDSYAWDIKQVDNRLFIRPKQSGVLTNMTIITNERPYHFELYSSKLPIEQTDVELVYVAKFYYPETAYDFMQTVRVKKPLKQYNLKPVNEALEEERQNNQSANIPTPMPSLKSQQGNTGDSQAPQVNSGDGLYNYAYSMVGPESDITPAKVYDDGINTYFEFSGNELPDIFYVNQDGSETPAKYSVEKGVVTVKNTAWQFSLRNNQNLICVFNELKMQRPAGGGAQMPQPSPSAPFAPPL